ncbi:MAG: adenylate/guanylate cyclase domain-containing protein [Treponemataceae bacterium]|nr:adenylate/guanylate cyclase domain-containing protein [Treponemataceae bacterium]
MASREKQLKNISKYGNFVGIDGKVFENSDGKSKNKGSSCEFEGSFITHEQFVKEINQKQRSNQRKIEKRIKGNQKSYKKLQKKIQKQNERLESKNKKLADKHVKNAKPLSSLRTSIGAKLIFMISLVVILALSSVTFIVSYFVAQDIRVSAEENNLTINNRTKSDCMNRINSVVTSVDVLMKLIGESIDQNEKNKNSSMFYERYPEIISVSLPDSGEIFVNNRFLTVHEIKKEQIESYILTENEALEESATGEFVLKNASPFFMTPVIAIFSPVDGVPEINNIVIMYSSEKLYESFASGSINQSFYVNQYGEVLVHPDYNVMMNFSDFSDDPVVAEMISNSASNGQHIYGSFNESIINKVATIMGFGDSFIGAYSKVSDSNSAVITTVVLSTILEGVKTTMIRNLYLTGAILALAVMIMWLYARSITVPLKRLANVADEINQANFNTPLFEELYTHGHDEVAVLTNSTKNEREILNTMIKLTNVGVVKSVVQKKIDFNPHLKDITIFFSDIRGFTAISDGFNTRFGNRSGAEIIGFLNDYMSRMVQCIKITGGVVDKFEGDAIMACWGVLRNDSLDFEDMDDGNPEKKKLESEHQRHKEEDALSAIRATVAMRYSLRKYNKDAEIFTKKHADEIDAKYKPHIKIGSGLNSGRATVGFMGSMDKMEFTSIGDAVNLASRTESSNKPCGTDILITQDTYDLLKMNFIRCPENNYTISEECEKDEVVVEKIPVQFEVKGKGKQNFYGVVNMPQFDVQEFFEQDDEKFVADADCLDVVGPRGPKTLKEMRILLGIAEPDFGGVNLDESENKIQISTN